LFLFEKDRASAPSFLLLFSFSKLIEGPLLRLNDVTLELVCQAVGEVFGFEMVGLV